MADPAATTTSPDAVAPSRGLREIFDPYLGTVYGNILDLYDNPTYNIKFSVVRTTAWNEAKKNINSPSSPAATAETSASARSDTPAANTAPVTSTVESTQYKGIGAGDQVVLAQTGVTATQIEYLKMLKTVNDGASQLSFEMKIIQPGAADFIDQMQIARKWLNRADEPGGTFSCLLEISFMGRKADPADEDVGGAPVVVDGPYGWLCSVLDVKITVDATGSNYTLILQHEGAIAYNDRDFRIPVEIPLRNFTLDGILKDLEASVNAALKKNASSSNFTEPDEYVIDTSKLIGPNKPLLPVGAKLLDAASADMGSTSTASTGESRVGQDAPTNENPQPVANDGKPNITYKGVPINIEQGKDFYNAIVKILAACPDFTSKISNLENINDPNSAADKKRLAVSWVTVETDVEYKKFDPKRNDYTKKITIRPVIFETMRPDLRLKVIEKDSRSAESQNQENAATYKLQELRKNNQLVKSYKYLWTGLNDQILKLDLNFTPTATILTAARDGLVGDTEVAAAPMMGAAQPATQNLNVARGVLGVVDQLKDAQKFVGLLKELKDNQLNSIAGLVGGSVAELKQLQQSGNADAARALADKLSSVTLNRLSGISDQARADAAAGGTPAATNPDGSTYDPGSSGLVYAEQIVTEISGGLSIDQLQRAGFIKASDLGASTFDMVPASTQEISAGTNGPATSIPAPRGSPVNVLFNYMYAKQMNPNALLKLDMTIRGDPWYLGIAKDKSTADQSASNILANAMYILLQVGAVQPYDVDVRDEDANSGYWNMRGMVNSMSGVFNVLAITNTFQNGVFTTSLVGNKDFDVPLYKIRPLEPGKPSELMIDAATGETLTNEQVLNNVFKAPKPDTGTGGAGGGTDPNYKLTGGPGGKDVSGRASPFGEKGYTVTSQYDEARPNEIHKGIDLVPTGGPSNATLYPPVGGKVVYVGDAGGYGKAVYVDIGNGLQMRLGHMSAFSDIKVGQTITTDTPLGNMGSTGRSTGPHLHLELRQGDASAVGNSGTTPIDPRGLLPNSPFKKPGT